MIKAVIFDLDGVIVDSEPLHFEAHKKALKQFGVDLTREDYMSFGVAQGDKNLYEKASEKYGINFDIDELSVFKKKFYRELFEQDARPREGVVELLKALNNEYELAIASSGAREVVKMVLESFSLKQYFTVIVTGDDIEHAKPSPDAYEEAVTQLGYQKNECVAIEDSVSGLQSAKSAGLKCVAIPCEFTKNQDFGDADLLLGGPNEISGITIESLA